MTEPMLVDVDGLRGAEPRFRYLSSAVDGALGQLLATLDAQGPCWGGDQLGARFAETYLPASELIRRALPDLRDDVRDVGVAVVSVADNVDAAEGRAQARLS
jgi:hypothetical protein